MLCTDESVETVYSGCRATRGHRGGCAGSGAVARSRTRAARAERAKETTRRCFHRAGTSYPVMEDGMLEAISRIVPRVFAIFTGQTQLQ